MVYSPGKGAAAMNERILVVDDEREIAELVGLYLKNEGYRVLTAYDGARALDIVEREELSLAVLDVMLPDIDGFTLCQRIRERHLFPIVMLTARVEDMDKITGLTLGADDYVTKPFNPLDIRGLHISKSGHRCTVNGREVSLTPTEFSILWYLCARQGQVASSEELSEAVWNEKSFEANNTVMTHIARLREKLHEPARKPKYIKTVWGVGYVVE